MKFYSTKLQLLMSVLAVLIPACALAEEIRDYSGFTLEELMDVQVTSVAKREQKVSESPAAIFVITSEDIRRSTATNIPDLLRLVPGLHVGKINSSTAVVSSRGFTDLFSNKLLVLIDGRTVYTPLFSGVYWDVQDVVLEDIDRIEVIRGPGATLWGSNAVNGVINIITKSARETEGTLVSGGAGNEERGFGTVRHGGKFEDDGSYRVYAKYNNRDESTNEMGLNPNDAWSRAQTGFRTDWQDAHGSNWNVQGDAYVGEADGTAETVLTSPPFFETHDKTTRTSGANAMVSWNREINPELGVGVKTYYDKTTREDFLLKQSVDSLDSELEFRYTGVEMHTITLGTGYRFYQDKLTQVIDGLYFTRAKDDVDLYRLFVQDEIQIVPDQFRLIVGSKFEHTAFSGFEYQPNIRGIWTPNERNSFWAAVSRAVRTPSRIDQNLRFVFDAFPRPDALSATLVELQGLQERDSERLIAYETGYRGLLHDAVSFDVTTFYHQYSEIGTIERGTPGLFGSGPNVVVPAIFQNQATADGWGVETVLTYKPLEWLTLIGSYSFLNLEVSLDPTSTDTFNKAAEDSAPQNSFFVRSVFDLPYNTEFDTVVRYVDSTGRADTDSYTELDLRLAWFPSSSLELAIIGQNLLASSHKEMETPFVRYVESEVERGVYGKATWRY